VLETKLSTAKIASMVRTIFLYGAALAVLVFVLKFIEYRFLVRDLSLEFYLGVVAILFTVVGIWTGNRLTRKRIAPSTNTPFEISEETLKSFGISKREHEVLALMAQGFSNQEIADKLFVSLNTVKTHSSNLFLKLQVKRRTQAIQKAKELQLIP
jgi:DNA-binding CsgD family transcriptional regulator